jgi:ankyrin repeat protein
MKNHPSAKRLLPIFVALAAIPHPASAQVYCSENVLAPVLEAEDATALRALVESNPALAATPDDFELTALHCGWVLEDAALTRFLIERGANVNAPSKLFGTPLHRAVVAGNPETVALLIEKGGDPHAQDHDGLHAMHFIAWTKDTPSARAIFDLLLAIAPGLVDDPGTYGATPLWMCVDRINVPAAKLLVDHGADPDKAPDGPGSSAREFLESRKKEETNLATELAALEAVLPSRANP